MHALRAPAPTLIQTAVGRIVDDNFITLRIHNDTYVQRLQIVATYVCSLVKYQLMHATPTFITNVSHSC